MTLGILMDRICEAVGDPSKARYSEAVIMEGLRLALEEYSRAVPQIKETTITVEDPGRDQIVTGVSDLLYFLGVFFPVEAGSAPEIESYYAYLRDGAQWISIEPPARVPQVGDVIKITYAALHTIVGLGPSGGAPAEPEEPEEEPEEEPTTIPLADFGLLVQGAAGHAMSIRADSIIESYGKRTPQDDTFQAAKRRLDDFRRRLRGRKGPEMPAAPFGGVWKMDRWDGNH
jgi:hypothetical protein